ncbi:hypothetical protein [Robiginitalea sp. IMCC43444]|uniref:hypothetical protein n=1 Tax=Robiginitalea sp. IMCC43444 TaxID=3459121 RepID=UPI00404256CA
MNQKAHQILAIALILGLIFHGVGIFFTLESTYDALIHLFFADHYAKDWFEPWDFRWYTGFTVQAYPPLVHQCIALLSYVGGLKFGLFTMALLIVVLFISGIYRFAKVLTGSEAVAGYTALISVFSSMFLETLHLFGQLPSLMGIAVLLHAMPEIYAWVRYGKARYLVSSLSLIAVTVTSHHVTPVFGMVFFIFPLIGLVIMDVCKDRVKKNRAITFSVFWAEFRRLFWRIVTFGMGSLILIVVCILPYWVNTKNNPITQVPIPHGSRDNFLEVTSSGLVFFIIPWGILLLLLPYLFYRFFSKRLFFFGLSFSLLFLLGTGGTTPLPKILLGENAFNILTLDRFTLWASIMALPLFGEFVWRLTTGDINKQLEKFVMPLRYTVIGVLGTLYVGIAIFTMSLGYFRPAQPQKIKMLPIVNFLNQDQHDQWRYLTLGFGDQMAWLSAQTNAMTVDGNYHSARRLPELTTRAIERLENSKFRGVEGIGSLQQFLTVPEKYHLKYIFSNDKFYDPILYFCGWQRLQQLENGIMVWERLNVSPLPKIIPKESVNDFLKIMWGIIPLATLVLAFICNIQLRWWRRIRGSFNQKVQLNSYIPEFSGLPPLASRLTILWAVLMLLVFSACTYRYYALNNDHGTPENLVKAYYDALDYKEFEKAHAYLDPESSVSIAQFMLERSVTDGLLGSYAKLDSLEVERLETTNNAARLTVSTKWITPLETIRRSIEHQLVQRGKKWFLIPVSPDRDIPPNQLVTMNETQFFNHGRRRVTSQQTHHEDVLRQPVLEVLSAKMVRFKGRYSIVGQIQNIDNVPADISVTGSLYDKENKVLARYNAKYHLKHKLMPKEITAFRIDFEGIAWSSADQKMPGTFDPETFTPVRMHSEPVTFDLQCAGNVATSDLYKSMALQQLNINKGELSGMLYNSGIQEITIPQLLVAYEDDSRGLVWVDHHFLLEGVRVQRTQPFQYQLKNLEDLEVLQESLEKCFVNGIPNREIQKKFKLQRDRNPDTTGRIQYRGAGYHYISIDMNAFIGNPRR